jgi:hypothetical protein
MLENVNNGQSLNMDSLNQMAHRASLKVGSTNKTEDESVEALINKLNKKGAKVKILKDGEEETPNTDRHVKAQSTSSKKSNKAKKLSNKENT